MKKRKNILLKNSLNEIKINRKRFISMKNVKILLLIFKMVKKSM